LLAAAAEQRLGRSFALEIIALAAGSTFRGISFEKIRGLIRRLLVNRSL